MKLSLVLAAAASAGTASAFPGMRELLAGLAKRQTPALNPEMIGDLVTDGATTTVGHQVQDCLTGAISCENNSTKTYVPPGQLGSDKCAQDTCCVWDYIGKDLVQVFLGSDGTCTDLARAAVRFGFHDAGAWSKTSGFGGADGSLILSPDEIARTENRGLEKILVLLKGIYDQYHNYGVGAADLAQFAHNVATVICPLGPRILTWVGRDDSAKSPTGLLPDTHSPVDDLIKLFADKTINVRDLISLIGAHTAAKQFFVDPSKAGQPLDSTPGVWDVKFYQENLLDESPAGVFRLPSDAAFARDNRTEGGFVTFSNATNGQTLWNAFYSTAYVRLSLLGVNKINKLVDCTHVLPSPVTVFPPVGADKTITDPSACAANVVYETVYVDA